MIKDLWYIVSMVKQDLDMDSNTHDIKFFKWAQDGYKEAAHSNVIKNCFKAERIPIINHRAQLPDDYVDYYKIGICRGGYMLNFTANDGICLAAPKVDCCGEELGTIIDQQFNECCFNSGIPANLPYPYAYWDYSPYFKNGQFIAGMYGRGANVYTGGYRVDLANMEIVLDRCVHADELVLEYKSTGVKDDGNAVVPEGCEKGLQYYVHWQRKLHQVHPKKTGIDFSEEDRYRRQFQRSLKRMNARINGLKLIEVQQIIRASIHQAPKR